ncbi:Spy0128 family protein [Collinsella aerofaciens]|uniref:Spy0128 family protein n=1 Tax=Collinsella aerofaciens TaxID=74426 RepID=UPI0010FD6646|nr:FctA domain-containing protein [Collinsella aerofaciens]
MTGKVADPDTSGRWEIWAAGHGGNKVTTQNVGRIWTDKTVEATEENEESDFLTTLSAMSSTSNSTVTVTTPLDIVMVLDASGSMDDPMGGGDRTKRIDALKNAANSFIDTIAKQNESIEGVDRQHRVAIVKFAGEKSNNIGNNMYRDGGYSYNYTQVMKELTYCSGSNADDLKKNTINKIQPAGATRADYGLELAEKITTTYGRKDAKKIIVFFTDGTPTKQNKFDAGVANAAVTAAKNMKDGKATVYTIGIFDGANPKASVQDSKTSQENKFMQAVSSNYPNATAWDAHGARAENSDYYKSATDAEELKKVFDDISQAITSEAPYPTEIDKGYDATKSGYITFTDELGDFMQVDSFTEVVINGTPFTKTDKTVNKETNTDTYEFTGKAKDLLITVQRAGDDNPQKGDVVTVSIPASLIPLSHFKTVDGKLSVDSAQPIRVKYTSSVKSTALDNLFTPEKVTGLKDYIENNTTVANGAKTVNFYANKWAAGDLGNTVATFEPADTNRYYYFQKQTPIYTDKGCTQPAKNSLTDTGTYYYKDEFEERGENGEAKPAAAVIEFIGGDAAKFDGAIVADEGGNLSFSVGTARLAFIDELHTTKESVGGNNTGTATDVLNPKWNNVSAKATATHVNSYLGNNGKISFNVTPTTVDTKASFGLTKVLEGRSWTDADEFKFELSATPKNDAPMPASTDTTVHKPDPDGKAAIDFGEITYNKPGEYTYEVREVKGDAGGITYSKNVATFKVTVAVNATGGLKADVEKISGETEFKNTYSAKMETPLTLEATKTLTGRPMADDEFKFALSYAGHDEVLLDATNKGGKVEFGPLTYTTKSLAKLVEEDKASLDASSDKPTWTIHYIAAEQTGKLPAGVSATVSAIDACVTVVDNGDGTLTATAVYGDAGNEFVNTYTAAPAEASLVGKKNLQVPKGLTPADIAGKFTFTVTGEDGAPMPANASVTNHAKGKVDFGKITFTLDDLNKALGEKPEKREHTFTYTVTESGEVAGVTNDAKLSREVSFTVIDDGKGNLSVSHKPDGDVAFTFTNTYNVTPVETSVTDQITANKVLIGRDLKEGEFSFELVEGNKVVATGINDAEGNITMSAVKYTEAGEHTYTLREVNGGTISKGITYGDAKYTIETTITDKGDGTLKAEHVLKDAKTATFKNTYSVTPTDADLDFDLSKAIDGREWTDGDEFSFTITAPDGAPLPDPATVTVSKHDAKDGIAAIKFGKIRYTAAGTYKYEIRENAGNTVGMTYDSHVATAEVTVTENGDGNLTANVTKKENGRFTNKYRTELNYTAAGGLWLSKYLDGRPMTEGQFTFTVTPADDASARALGLLPGANSFKSPAAAEATVGLIDILAGHEVIFTQADAGKTFTYTVAEKNDGQPGYTYDDAVRTVTIAIADDTAGTLTATTTVSGGPEGTHETVHKSGENKVEKALVPFHNSYSATTNTPGGTAAQVVATKTLTGRPMADGEFWFGIAYQGELVAYENLKPNIGGHVSFDTLHYDTKMLANLEAAGLAYRTDKDGKLAWTINYTAYEDLFGLPNGVSATTWSFGFKVIVVDNGDGTLTATVDYGGVEPLFENVYGAEAVDAALTGTKKLQAAEGLTPADITGKFTFTVTADEASAPMPERTTATNDAAGNVDFGKIHFTLEDDVVVANGTNDANGTVTLSPIRYEAPGTHTYTLREACPNALGLYKGVTYDGTTYTVVTTVSDNGDGTLTATHKLEGTTESAGFTNKYHAMPTQVSIGAIKVLEGRELKKDEFSFKLVGEDIESTVTNDADGKINFDKFEYDEPGTHAYTISEVKGDEVDMTYDKSVFTVTVNVVDDGEGNLKANVAFTKGDRSVEGIVFNNTYKKPETPVPTPDPGTPKTVTNIVKTVKGFLPTTGDQQAAALLMAFVIAMAGVGALVWGIRKR